MIPLTVAGAIANQNTDPWSDPPEQLKGMAGAEASFEVMQMILPGIITGGLASAGGDFRLCTAVSGLLLKACRLC